MPNAAGVRPLYPLDGYTRKILGDFEAAVFARAIAMSIESAEDEDSIQYAEANAAYRATKTALIRRISKLISTPSVDPEPTKDDEGLITEGSHPHSMARCEQCGCWEKRSFSEPCFNCQCLLTVEPL